MICLGHSLHHYIGDAIAPDTKTDTTLDPGIKEATSFRVEPNIKHCDTLDDWKGERGEKEEQKGAKEEENGKEAEHDEEYSSGKLQVVEDSRKGGDRARASRSCAWLWDEDGLSERHRTIGGASVFMTHLLDIERRATLHLRWGYGR